MVDPNANEIHNNLFGDLSSNKQGTLFISGDPSLIGINLVKITSSDYLSNP